MAFLVAVMLASPCSAARAANVWRSRDLSGRHHGDVLVAPASLGVLLTTIRPLVATALLLGVARGGSALSRLCRAQEPLRVCTTHVVLARCVQLRNAQRPGNSYAFATGAAVDRPWLRPTTNETPGPFGVTIGFSGGRLDFGHHSEWLATDYGCSRHGKPILWSNYCSAAQREERTGRRDPCLGFQNAAGTGCQAEQTTAWAAENQATEARTPRARSPAFTFEWTYSLGTTDDDSKQTLHKNVFFGMPACQRADRFPRLPDSQLWAALANSATAARAARR